jgi:hypothetical protein
MQSIEELNKNSGQNTNCYNFGKNNSQLCRLEIVIGNSLDILYTIANSVFK